MGMPKRLTKRRFEVILERQDPPAFGKGYQPSIKATREEAPAGSRPAEVWSELLQRDIATLSEPERDVLPVALYCPWLFELHEERLLPFLPSSHPLEGHPLATGLMLPAFRGTLAVAAELGCLRYHPVVAANDGDDEDPEQDESPEPGCWIGDFLLFLKDASGPYCVNLNIKSTRAEFSEPSIGVTPKTNMTRARLKELARHKVEEVLYQDVGIPTFEIATDELHPMVVANLRQNLLWQKRKHSFNAEQQEEIVEAFNQGMESGVSALEAMHALEVSRGFSTYETKIVLYQAIWRRELRIDLFERFYIDKPMVPEYRDVLDEYAPWFRRPKL
jgi:hypothetical protein